MYLNTGPENPPLALNFMGKKLRNHTVGPAAKQRAWESTNSSLCDEETRRSSSSVRMQAAYVQEELPGSIPDVNKDTRQYQTCKVHNTQLDQETDAETPDSRHRCAFQGVKMVGNILSALSLLIVVSLIAVQEQTETLSCPEQQQAYKGSCYEFVALQRNFHRAQEWCERGGGHLAFIQNDETKRFLQNHLQPEQNWWLGVTAASVNLTHKSTEGSMSWLDGSDLSYSNWRGQPGPGVSCGFISKDSGFRWETTSNCSQEFYFICQYESGHVLVCVDHSTTLQCGTGQVMVIRESFYGRKTVQYCRTGRSSSYPSEQEECSWIDVTDFVTGLCNGKQVCDISTVRSSFKDPCPSLGSYLAIKFHCKYAVIRGKTFSSQFKRSPSQSNMNNEPTQPTEGNESKNDTKDSQTRNNSTDSKGGASTDSSDKTSNNSMVESSNGQSNNGKNSSENSSGQKTDDNGSNGNTEKGNSNAISTEDQLKEKSSDSGGSESDNSQENKYNNSSNGNSDKSPSDGKSNDDNQSDENDQSESQDDKKTDSNKDDNNKNTCVTVPASNDIQINVTCSTCEPVDVNKFAVLNSACFGCQTVLWYFEDTPNGFTASNSCSKDKGQMLLKLQATNVTSYTVPSATLKAAKNSIRVVVYGSKDGKAGYGFFSITLPDASSTLSPAVQTNVQSTTSNSSQTNILTTASISTGQNHMNCTISPPFGDILSPFNITCTITGPFFCSGLCSFCLITSNGKTLYCGSEEGMRSIFLPLGNKIIHYGLELQVIAKDMNGRTLNATLFTQVSDTNSTIQDLHIFVSQHVTQWQQQGTFSAAQLAPILQSVSHKLNRGSSDGMEKSDKRKLREEMLVDMCAALTQGEPFKVFTEAQVTADLVLSLVLHEDELTYNAQLQACCVLKKVSQSLTPLSAVEGDFTPQLIHAATPIVHAASNILKASSNSDNQREISALLLNITDIVQSSMLARKKPNQEPIYVSTPLITLYVNRLSPGNLQFQHFRIDNSSSASFLLPSLGSDVLLSEEPVDVRMLSFGMNPFSWREGEPIGGTVGGLSLTRENGSVILVTNLTEDIEILLPRQHGVDLNVTFLDLRNYSTLAINVTTPNSSLVLKLDPSEKIPLQLHLGFQYYPNDTHYKAKTQLPQAENCPAERYTWVLDSRDMALEAGVYYLLVRPVAEAGANSSSASVFVTSIGAQCKYWDESKIDWNDSGCRVGPRTTALVTQCLCTHLTFFGSSFFVMPNRVDVSRTAELFATFVNNPVVVCYIGALFLTYVMVVIWARRKDLQDIGKVKVTVLEDNDPLAEYRYILVVSTGYRRGASTSSNVTVTLMGTVWESEPHHLTDPDKPLFERGGVDMFLITTPFSLGEVKSIRLWHDNSGKHPAWYVNKVMIQDLETGQKWHFLCSSWLATDMGDYTLDKIFSSATEADLKGFSNLFFMKTAKDLCDGHIWYSVVSRPPSSNFTRVQRVSCCFSLLLCTMLTSIMFWGVPSNPSEQSTDIGNFKFSWKQVMIGIQSSVIMFPINLFIVSIFRNTRPRKKPQEEALNKQFKLRCPKQEINHSDIFPQWCTQKDVTIELVVKDLKRIIRSLAKALSFPYPKHINIPEMESEKTAINTLLSLVEDIIRQQEFSLDQICVDSQKEFLSLYWRFLHKQLQNVGKELSCLEPSQFCNPEDYTQAVLQVQGMMGLLEPHLSPSFTSDQATCSSSPPEGSKTCCKKGLPWWFVLVGWFLIAATSGVSGYFTMMYGLTYGRDRSISWLISILVSFFESLFVTQPIKVVGFAIFFALVVKNANDDEDGDYIYLMRDKILTIPDVPDDVRISRRDSTCSVYRPPPPCDVEKIKENKMKDQKAFAIIVEIFIYIGFFSMLLVSAYGQRDPNAYLLTQHIQNSFGNGISDSMKYNDVFNWANSTLINNLFGQKQGFITDGNSKLVGNARLRQVRVHRNSCKTASSMRSSIPECRARYSWEEEDMGSYRTGWKMEADGNVSKALLMPWQYQTQSKLRTHPVWGDAAMYRGGGFVVELGPDKQNASSVLQYLQDNSWVDVYTRAIFVDFTVYNANVNLFCIVTLILENTAVGAFQYSSELHIVRLHPTADGIQLVVSEGIYFLFVLYYMFLQCKLMKQQKWRYFRDKWNILELAIIVLSWTALSAFIKRTVQGNQDLKYYQDHKDLFPSFYETARADAALMYIIAFLVLLATIKMWHLMRLNSKLHAITLTLQLAWNEISSFILVITLMILTYSIATNLLFGWKLHNYRTLIDAAQAMVSLQLGIFNYDEVLDLNPVLGAFIVGSCIIFMTFVVLNLFISVIIGAFSEVQQKHKPSEEEEIVNLLLTKICKFLGIKTKNK